MKNDLVLSTLCDGAHEICLNRPERMNALGVQTVKDLLAAVEQCVMRKSRVLLLRAQGVAFCAGADLKERKSMDLAERLQHNAGINAVNDAIAAAPMVSLAVIQGLAFGGGLEMALACDLRLAACGIQLGLTESRVGAFPGAGGIQRLTRAIGTPRALHMMLTGEPVSSEHALSMGLVNEVHPADHLQQRALELTQWLASRSALGQSTLRRLAYEGREMPIDQALRMDRQALPDILGSADYAEGLAAFEERRTPRFNSIH